MRLRRLFCWMLLVMAVLFAIPGFPNLTTVVHASWNDQPKPLYGPESGYVYSPAKLMEAMHSSGGSLFLSAHRGAWNATLPENSLQAIDNAASLRFEMVELDVKLDGNKNDTANFPDGKPYLIHDYSTGRLAYHKDFINQQDKRWDIFRARTYSDTDRQLLNPLVQGVDLSNYYLRNFNKQGTNNVFTGMTVVSTGNDLQLLGSFSDAFDSNSNRIPVPTLRTALEHIGNCYPGMTVVLDVRHLDEVRACLRVIDQVTDAYGTPAKDWVIIKPFGNVFPGGRYNANNPTASAPDPHSLAALVPDYHNYHWIPVVSNRIVADTVTIEKALTPEQELKTGNLLDNNGNPCKGPDHHQINGKIEWKMLTGKPVDTAHIKDWDSSWDNDWKTWASAYLVKYVRDWIADNDPAIVTMEVGKNVKSSQGVMDAYAELIKTSTNMQAYRPTDINFFGSNPGAALVVENKSTHVQRTVMGANWADDAYGNDGMGCYLVDYDANYNFETVAHNAGIITIDDTQNILNGIASDPAKRAARAAALRSVSVDVSGKVQVFVDSNCYGATASFSVGARVSNLDNTPGIGRWKISSLIVPEGLQVILYGNTDQNNPIAIYGMGRHNLPNVLNDKACSLAVDPGGHTWNNNWTRYPGELSIYAPVIGQYNGQIYTIGSWNNTADAALYYKPSLASDWTSISDKGASHGPFALTNYGGMLYNILSYGDLHVNKFHGSLLGWDQVTYYNNVGYGAGATVFNGYLYVFFRGNPFNNDNKIYYVKMDSSGKWFGRNEVPNWRIYNASYKEFPEIPSVTVHQGRLYLAIRGTDQKIYVRSMNTNEQWDETPGLINDDTFQSSPSIVSYKNELHLFARGFDNNIYHRVRYGNENSFTSWISDPVNVQAASPQSAVVLNNSIFLVIRGFDGNLYWNEYSPALLPDNNIYYLAPESHPDWRLDVWNNGGEGTRVVSYPDNGGQLNQRWKFYSNNDGTYLLEPQHTNGLGKRLDVMVHYWPYNQTDIWHVHGDTNQRWRLIKNNGYYEIQAICNNNMLTANDDQTAILSTEACTERPNQHWKLIEVNDQ